MSSPSLSLDVAVVCWEDIVKVGAGVEGVLEFVDVSSADATAGRRRSTMRFLRFLVLCAFPLPVAVM